jgi:hypothetical protein
VSLGGDRLQDVVHALAVEPCAGAGANGTMVVGGGLANACFTFAFGVTDVSSLVVSSCQLIGSLAQGGTEGASAVGDDGLCSGFFVGSETVMLKGRLVSSNQSQGGLDSHGNTSRNGLGRGVYIDPSASATADRQTLIAGNQASKSDNDLWGTITPGP